MLTVDVRSRTPLYEQIKNQIMELVVIGALQPHDPLPSTRQLAAQLSLNFNTVKKAYQDLETVGVIYTIVGRGTYVAENSLANQQLQERAAEKFRTALTAAMAYGLSQSRIMEMVTDAFTHFGKEDRHD